MAAHRKHAPPRRRPWASVAVALVAAVAVVWGVAAWAGVVGDDDAATRRDTSGTGDASSPAAADPSAATDGAPAPDPDEPLSWGPTRGEWQQAQDLVAGWTPEQLAGQVIVGRYFGTDPEEPATLVRELHLAGVSMTNENVADAAQVQATTAAVQAAVDASGRGFPAVVGVDQEGGLVSHLSGIATDFPAFEAAGAAIVADREAGATVVTDAARTTGLELRQLGFTWVWAPVADVTVGATDPTIGSRSPSTDPGVAAQAVTAALEGYAAAGLVSTAKHFPGHGSVTADSHDTLPVLSRTLAELAGTDLRPFEAAVAARAPAMMLGHLDVTALAPGEPATLADEVYRLLREDLGFEGVTVTDSLGMGAVVGRDQPAVTALDAGADLLLMPADTRRTHATVTAAIESGEVSRARAEEAAARVVALQLWQQRRAGVVPVPEDVASQAAQAAAALAAAG